MTDRYKVAAVLGVSFNKHIVYYLYRLPIARRYVIFFIPKKNGGQRRISVPFAGLKTIQRRLSKLLYRVYPSRSGVHGFSIGRGTQTNAQNHVRRRYVLNLDLKDFFPTINFGRVRGLFQAEPYNLSAEVATILAQICCDEKNLPQGAPTSPIVSNMICGRLDTRLKQLAFENDCSYTRYADDITFSTHKRPFPRELARIKIIDDTRKIVVGAPLRRIIEENGFSINESKVRLLSRADRQEVTGLTVNRFVNVPRRYIRSIRGALNAWRKYGLASAESTFHNKYTLRSAFHRKPSFEKSLFGRIQYVGSVRGWNDRVYQKLRDEFNFLSTIKIPRKEMSWEEKASRAIWVIEDSQLDIQGTAFFLEGYGLVTCNHCIGDNPFIYHPSAPLEKFRVKVKSWNDAVDLATLEVEGTPNFTELSPQKFDLPLQLGETVKLLGYPGFAAGKGISIKDGQVHSFTMKSAIRRFNISALILAGSSGGPVVNRYQKVTGVAVTGGSSQLEAMSTEEHGVIPISALKHLSVVSDVAQRKSIVINPSVIQQPKKKLNRFQNFARRLLGIE